MMPWYGIVGIVVTTLAFIGATILMAGWIYKAMLKGEDKRRK